MTLSNSQYTNTLVYVEVENLSKRYGSRLLFHNRDFSIDSGQCLGITGQNGSGKSTLIKVIAGIIRPSSGRIRICANGMDLDDEQRLTYMGMVSPEVCLYDSLTGIENIAMLAGIRGIRIDGQHAALLCAKAGLGHKGSERVRTYSTGMKQRLKIALLMAVNASLWLLDEPSSNLDVEGRETVFGLLSEALLQER